VIEAQAHEKHLLSLTRGVRGRHGAGIQGYVRFKAVRPGSTPVNPAKVRPTRRRKSCLRCHHSMPVKRWRMLRQCSECGWVPKPYRRARAA
jgi:hypothetical protein